MFAITMAALASPSLAQRGTIRGSVVDASGKRLAYANIILPGTRFGAMTAENGEFSMDVPPGRYVLKSLNMGYHEVSQGVAVGLGETVNLRIRLGEPKPPAEPTVTANRARPETVSRQVTEEQLAYRPGNYPASTQPVRSGSLEASVRYEEAEDGDSTRVRVIAEAVNVTKAPIRTCGCFSFWNVDYGVGPEVLDSIPLRGGGQWLYRGSKLDVARRECDSPVLACEPVVLAPGESVSRRMSFAFETKPFATWPGEVTVTCIFFHGEQGASWIDTEHVILDPLRVPIRPIGMPYRRP